MAGVINPPRIYLRIEDPEWKGFLETELHEFPITTSAPPSAREWTFAHLQIVDMESAEKLMQELQGNGDPLLVFASSILFHPISAPSESLSEWYRRGFAYICENKEELPALKVRLQAILRLRSQHLTQKAVNFRLAKWLETQKKQSTNQTDFLHMAVHDLRGPLAAMICYAELLMEGVLGNLQATQLEPIRTIHRNCQFLIDMVNDLLDSAKLESGKIGLNLEKTDFNHEVEQAVQSLRGLADTKRIQLKLELDKTPEMFLDIQKVGRILTNLLGNAIKFTRASGEIVLKTGVTDDTMVFSIQDMGPGISPADRQAIFKKFHTGSGSNIAGKGHGLGLAICKSFAELHGGKIYVESTRHKGSVFIVHLPLEKRKKVTATVSGASRKVLILDLAQDFPELSSLEGLSTPNLGYDFMAGAPKIFSHKKLPVHHYLVVNEPEEETQFLGSDFLLLRLEELKGNSPCVLVVPNSMPEREKELRIHLGFFLIEKPCTLTVLFDKLLGVVGHNRRK